MPGLSIAQPKKAVFAPLVIATLLVSGCATMNAEQCVSADWYAIGIQDGSLGHTPDRLRYHDRSCARHDMPTDTGSYHAGRMEGLKIYCTIENGVQAGKSGNPYRGVCPGSHEQGFLSGYYVGALSAFGD